MRVAHLDCKSCFPYTTVPKYGNPPVIHFCSAVVSACWEGKVCGGTSEKARVVEKKKKAKERIRREGQGRASSWRGRKGRRGPCGWEYGSEPTGSSRDLVRREQTNQPISTFATLFVLFCPLPTPDPAGRTLPLGLSSSIHVLPRAQPPTQHPRPLHFHRSSPI